MSNWAEYFYDSGLSRVEFEKREEAYQAFKSRLMVESGVKIGLVEIEGEDDNG